MCLNRPGINRPSLWLFRRFCVLFLFLFIISFCYDFMELKFVHYLVCSRHLVCLSHQHPWLFPRFFQPLSCFSAFVSSLVQRTRFCRQLADFLAISSYILFDVVPVCAETSISLYALTTLFSKKSFPVQSSSDKWNKTIAVATFF